MFYAIMSHYLSWPTATEASTVSASRDIKPSNLFLSNRKVIIGDLGLGRHLEQHSLAETQVGTPLYSAPEVCSGMPYTFSADVWAFGYGCCMPCSLEASSG